MQSVLYQNMVGLKWERIFENTELNVWIAFGKDSWRSPSTENFKVYTVVEFIKTKMSDCCSRELKKPLSYYTVNIFNVIFIVF